MSPEDSIERLQAENAELRARLEESEETLRAIRSGEVDALVVEGSAGPQVFILQTADADSNRFRSDILAKVSDAIVAIDDDQRVLYLNAAAERQYGVTSSGTLGRALTDLYENRWIRPGDEELFTKALRETGSWRGEHIHIKRDGKAIHVESAVSRLIAADGAPSGQLSVIRDVTERKQVERALAAQTAALLTADRSKDEFLAMLAHELRNPLAPLRNAAELLQARDATGEEREEAQRIICRQIENMSRMLDDLLDVSRITEGKIDLRKQPVALEAVLNAATNLVQAQSIANGQELKVSLSEEPIYLNADATRLEQIFGNLLTNSCKYSGKGSRISLSAERAEGVEPPEVIVRVRDDGAGIDAELVPRIFDLFVQATRALDRAHGGLGIGLTLVQRLVHLHGGRVEAHSDGPGCGAEFTVHLPILREAPRPAAPARPVSRETPRRILIVDDNVDSARSLAALQSRRGHLTRIAFAGPEALAIAAEFAPEVVLLDIGLPGMDGFEVARQLRGMKQLNGVMLIAMSGYGSPEDRATAKQAGFSEYMVKPANLNLLREWLENGV